MVGASVFVGSRVGVAVSGMAVGVAVAVGWGGAGLIVGVRVGRGVRVAVEGGRNFTLRS